MDILIRSERPTDEAAVEKVTMAAFAGKWYSSQTEHLIVNELRKTRALSLSLVATVDETVLGHIGFSAVKINSQEAGWHGIGPVSVQPEFQKQGIGSKLVRAGLSKIIELGARGCVLEGSPAYYQRFGFKSYPGLHYKDALEPENFMAFPFYDEIPEGIVEFHPAFYIQAD